MNSVDVDARCVRRQSFGCFWPPVVACSEGRVASISVTAPGRIACVVPLSDAECCCSTLLVLLCCCCITGGDQHSCLFVFRRDGSFFVLSLIGVHSRSADCSVMHNTTSSSAINHLTDMSPPSAAPVVVEHLSGPSTTVGVDTNMWFVAGGV